MNNTHIVVDTEYFLENISKNPFISTHFPYGKNVVLHFVISKEESCERLITYLLSLKKLSQQIFIYRVSSVYYNMFRYELLYSLMESKTYFYAKDTKDFYEIKGSEQIKVSTYKLKNKELELFATTKNYIISDKNYDFIDKISIINPSVKNSDINQSEYTKEREKAFSILSNESETLDSKITKTKFCKLALTGVCNRKICNYAHHFNELSCCLFGNSCKMMFSNYNRCPYRHPIENPFMFCSRTSINLPKKMMDTEEKEKCYKIPKNMVESTIQTIIKEGIKNVRIEIV